jgi:hypothetical protein
MWIDILAKRPCVFFLTGIAATAGSDKCGRIPMDEARQLEKLHNGASDEGTQAGPS